MPEETLGISMPRREAMLFAKTAGLIGSRLTPTVPSASVTARRFDPGFCLDIDKDLFIALFRYVEYFKGNAAFDTSGGAKFGFRAGEGILP